MPQPDTTRSWARFPILGGVLPIVRTQIPGEILGGLTLAALAVPEVMGYTKIAGTPVVTGLYTMLLPMVLFAAFGSSRHLVVGADSATATILSAGLVGLAATGSDQYVALASILAFMAAGLLFLARIIGLGFMADFLSRTVLIGFLTGVGIQVSAGQLAGMLGLAGGGLGTLGKIWTDLNEIEQVNFTAFTVALGVLLTTVGAKRVSHKIPGALIAVIGATLVSWAFDLQGQLPVVGEVPGGLPNLGLPQVAWSWQLVESLLPTAFAMFVVILAQSAATSRAYAVRYNEPFTENGDLVGLGFANLGAGLSGTFVVNGSPTKTQMVDSAGGRTQLSLLAAAGIVLLVLLFFTKPLTYLPDAVLSAVVFLIGVELIDIKGMRKIFTQRRSEFWVALITTSTVVLVGVEQGILLAMALSLIDHTRRGYRPKNAVLVPAKSGLRARPVTSHAEAMPGLIIYRFTHGMYYANAQQLADEVLALVEQADPPLRWFCIDASAVDEIDYSAAKTLRSLRRVLKQKGIRLIICEILEDIQERDHRLLRKAFGKHAYFETLPDVIEAYQQDTEEPKPDR